MSTTTYKVPTMLAETISMCYDDLKAARQYALDIANDTHNNAPTAMKIRFLHLATDIKNLMERQIESRIPQSVYTLFQDQIKEQDAFQFDNIKRLFMRMDSHKRDLLELAAEAILKNEIEVTER